MAVRRKPVKSFWKVRHAVRSPEPEIKISLGNLTKQEGGRKERVAVETEEEHKKLHCSCQGCALFLLTVMESNCLEKQG